MGYIMWSVLGKLKCEVCSQVFSQSVACHFKFSPPKSCNDAKYSVVVGNYVLKLWLLRMYYSRACCLTSYALGYTC